VIAVSAENILGRSAWAAIWKTRAALLEELEELKRTARVAVMGARVKRRANMVMVVCGLRV
jgi:hypothetical protein